MATGQIVRVTLCETEVETFVDTGTTTRNVVGMIADDAAGLLWVCDSDATFTTPPVLQAYDLATADLVASHDLGAVGFCNDLALGTDGAVYATDSGGARVVRVAAADRLLDTPVETWATDPEFGVAPGEFGVNGIALADDSTLYVVNYAQGELYRVPIEAGGDAGPVTLLDVGAGLAAPAMRSNLARAISRQGRHDEAIELAEAALADRRSALGSEHPLIVDDLRTVAEIYVTAASAAGTVGQSNVLLHTSEAYLEEAVRLALCPSRALWWS